MEKLLVGLNKIKKNKKIDQPIAIKLSPDIDDGDVSGIVEFI